jgi:hypothetical protein
MVVSIATNRKQCRLRNARLYVNDCQPAPFLPIGDVAVTFENPKRQTEVTEAGATALEHQALRPAEVCYNLPRGRPWTIRTGGQKNAAA